MGLFLSKSFNRVHAKRGLFLVLLCESVDECVIAIPTRTMSECALTLGPVRRSICSIVFSIFLTAETAECDTLLVVSGSRRREVIRRELPESEIEAWPKVTVSQTSTTPRQR